jgi:hypothetical protein
MSQRHLVVTLCLSIALITAGCAAPTTPDGSPPTLTANDATDANALIQVHTETLGSSSFTVHSRTTSRDTNETFRVTTTQTWRVEPSHPVRMNVTRTQTAVGDAPDGSAQRPDRITAWRHGNETTVRVELDTGSQVRAVDLLNSSARLNRALHRQLLYGFSTHRNATVENVTRNGTHYYRVQAELNDTHVSSNASMTLLVHRAGYVREIKTTRTVAYRSGPRVITRTVRFSRINETHVARPSWA